MKAEKQTIKRARVLRRSLTLPEIILWDQLRKKRQDKAKFRRQHPFGPYVLDFYCDQARLAVEVDGRVHDMGDNPARDARRDAWLAVQGIATLRILATDVLNNLDGVLHEINVAVLEGVERTSPSKSSPLGGSTGEAGEGGKGQRGPLHRFAVPLPQRGRI
jgi:very-short-patch-repair endonuclease